MQCLLLYILLDQKLVEMFFKCDLEKKYVYSAKLQQLMECSIHGRGRSLQDGLHREG